MGDSASARSSKPLRRLAGALEPVVGQVYFSSECHAAYTALGFSPSPGVRNGVALPDFPAYFTSRGSLMGQVMKLSKGQANPQVVTELIKKKV